MNKTTTEKHFNVIQSLNTIDGTPYYIGEKFRYGTADVYNQIKHELNINARENLFDVSSESAARYNEGLEANKHIETDVLARSMYERGSDVFHSEEQLNNYLASNENQIPITNAFGKVDTIEAVTGGYVVVLEFDEGAKQNIFVPEHQVKTVKSEITL